MIFSNGDAILPLHSLRSNTNATMPRLAAATAALIAVGSLTLTSAFQPHPLRHLSQQQIPSRSSGGKANIDNNRASRWQQQPASSSNPPVPSCDSFICTSAAGTKRKTTLFASVTPEYAADLAPGIDAINSQNAELYDQLNTIRTRPFFRLYSVDILASCEYIPQELFECYSESCEIYPVDDDEVPGQMKDADAEEHDFELDGWARWDMPTEDYYDTTQFPEEFTGYDGAEVWRFIHERISFQGSDIVDEYNDDSWKADFNRSVSGLHAMISAQVCRGIGDKIASGLADENETEWTDPKAEFDRRLGPSGETPKAIENLYFTYMLLLSAVAKAKGRLLADCDSGKIDAETASEIQPILSSSLLDDSSIEAASKRLHDHALKDDSNLWEARMRARELMRIMNCVQCNKCRLHGKISVMGVSTALNLLLGQAGEGGDAKKIHRVELAALMTTLGKFATAVDYCQSMLED